MKKDEIIKVNGEEYLILEVLNYNGQDYGFINKITENDESLNVYRIITANENSYQVVEDEHLANIFLQLFEELFTREIKDFQFEVEI